MTEKSLQKLFGLSLALVIVLFLLITVLYLAWRDGALPALLAGLLFVICLIAFSWRQITEGIRTLSEALMIHRATHYETFHTPGVNGRPGQRGYKITTGQAPLYLPSASPTINPATPPLDPLLRDRLTSPLRPIAISLVQATINDPAYGPNSTKLLSQERAIELGIVTGGTQHNQVTAFLCSNYRCRTENNRGSLNGTYCPATALFLMQDMALEQLPGVTR